MLAKTLKWAGLALGLGVGLAGCLLAAGYAFTDWPPGIATGITALWVLPTVVVSVYALRRPEPAARALLLAAVGITVFAVIDAFSDVIPSDDWGPVATVMDMALVVNVVMHETGALPPGPGFANAAVVLWMLLVGALFMLAETSERPLSAELGRLDVPAINGRRRVTR